MPATQMHPLFREPHCVPRLGGATKEEVISELIERFVASGALAEGLAPRLYAEVLAREEEATTGIGSGVALPHVRASRVVEEVLVAVGLHDQGLDFDATDGGRVHVVFLIASPAPAQYLPVAGAIARLARDPVEMRALRAKSDPATMQAFLAGSPAGVRR